GGAPPGGPAPPEPLPSSPRCGAERHLRRQPGLIQRDYLLDDPAMRDAPAGIRAGVEGDTRFIGFDHPPGGRGVKAPDVVRVRGKARRLIGDRREIRDIDQRWDETDAALGHRRNDLRGYPGAMLHAVDVGRDRVGDRLLAENMDRHPRPGSVRPFDRGAQHAGRPARYEMAGLPVDPVTNDLHPSVAAGRLHRDLVSQLRRLDLHAVVPQVPLGASDMPAGPDDAGQVIPIIYPAGVRWAPRVPDQERAGSEVGEGRPFLPRF